MKTRRKGNSIKGDGTGVEAPESHNNIEMICVSRFWEFPKYRLFCCLPAHDQKN